MVRMRIAWATDIHLNFCSPDREARFLEELADCGAEVVLFSGDISEAPELDACLDRIEDSLPAAGYFVLGNHDYYGAMVDALEKRMRDREPRSLFWLPGAGVVRLSSSLGLVGSGGWGDARNGDFLGTNLALTDYVLILDLQRSSGVDDPLAVLENRPKLQRKLMELGERSARELEPQLHEAARTFERVIVLTHVPPFPEMCWYRGRPTDDSGLPGFTCRAFGDMILEAAAAYPRCQITILSGHTHHDAVATLRPNLIGYTQGAVYGEPAIRLLDVD